MSRLWAALGFILRKKGKIWVALNRFLMSKILIADDNRELASLLSRSLEREGHSVQTAFDETSVLAGVRSQNYNLIILDLVMGETDGLALLKKLRAEGLKTPVLILGSSSPPQPLEVPNLPLNLQPDDYVTKPFSFQEFAERANAILHRYPSGRRESKIDSLRQEFDALLAQMQTPQASAAMKAAFDASPEELRKAAVTATNKRG